MDTMFLYNCKQKYGQVWGCVKNYASYVEAHNNSTGQTTYDTHELVIKPEPKNVQILR